MMPKARRKMSATCTADQSPPQAVLTPRAVSARATPRSDLIPLAWICWMSGSTLPIADAGADLAVDTHPHAMPLQSKRSTPLRSRSFLSRACLQIVAHDRTCRRAASDFLEASARERRGCYKDIRRTLRCARVDRISLERRNPRTLCGLHGRGDKL